MVGGFLQRFVLIGVGSAAVNSRSFLLLKMASGRQGSVLSDQALCSEIPFLFCAKKYGFGGTCGLPGSIPKNLVGL